MWLCQGQGQSNRELASGWLNSSAYEVSCWTHAPALCTVCTIFTKAIISMLSTRCACCKFAEGCAGMLFGSEASVFKLQPALVSFRACGLAMLCGLMMK